MQSLRPAPRKPIPFEMGRQSAEFFPVDRWRKLQSAVWAKADATMLYGSESGSWPALCRAIANYVGAARGLTVEPDQVIVVSSTQEAIDLIIRVLGRRGDAAWIEDPSYPLAHQVFRMNGIAPVPVPVDQQGLRVVEGRRLAPDARFACVTPACHFPTGWTMSPSRRRELLAWAHEHDTWIIEDDWEWHAHLGRRTPPPALQSLPGGERAIYIQTLNRTIFPTLRMAFLVAPLSVAARLLEVQQRMSGGPSGPMQATVARFLEEGLYAAYLRTSRQAYAQRRAALLDALRPLPPGYVTRPDRAGLHLIVETPAGIDDRYLAAYLRAREIECMGISEFALSSGSGHAGLALGFAAFQPSDLVAAADLLIRSINAFEKTGRS